MARHWHPHRRPPTYLQGSDEGFRSASAAIDDRTLMISISILRCRPNSTSASGQALRLDLLRVPEARGMIDSSLSMPLTKACIDPQAWQSNAAGLGVSWLGKEA
jgi:hypothetical protein